MLLKNMILSNELPPGFTALEADLAHRLGISRTPVREALIRLQADGLVESVPRRGIRVLPISQSDTKEIYELLAAVESKAASILAKRKPDRAMLAGLYEAADEMRRALRVDDRERWAIADEAFHRGIVELAGNQKLILVAATYADQARRVRFATIRLWPKQIESTRDHIAVLAAIQRGDGKLAQRLHEAHWERAGAVIIGVLQEYRLAPAQPVAAMQAIGPAHGRGIPVDADAEAIPPARIARGAR